MRFVESMIFYLVIGAGVAIAEFLSDRSRCRLSLLFRIATSALFWPLYLPLLLAPRHVAEQPEFEAGPNDQDAMSQAITQVEAELQLALASLDGWVENVLTHETSRFRELSLAWRTQASRIRAMDELLAQEECHPALSVWPTDTTDRCRQSEQTRTANLSRLRQVRGQAYDDLMDTLAWVRELVSMIHLAKFTGAPASRAEELVAQIAAAVEGISFIN